MNRLTGGQRHEIERRHTGRVETLAVILPFYNEEGFIGPTLASLAAQSRRPDQLILVDNASTDASPEMCRTFLAESGLTGAIHAEPRPGKIHALETGCRHIETDVVAFCDADTYYPPHYFAAALAAFAADPRCVSVMAPDLEGPPETPRIRFVAAKKRLAAALLRKQCHTGGFGQLFRTAPFRAAGAYSPALWPFVLEDHEIAHRLAKQGRMVMPQGLWCVPSQRRANRGNVNWTLFERLMYHATPFALKDWFFYEFLAARFTARGLSNINLRDRSGFAKASGHGDAVI